MLAFLCFLHVLDPFGMLNLFRNVEVEHPSQFLVILRPPIAKNLILFPETNENLLSSTMCCLAQIYFLKEDTVEFCDI